ncbi:hypothetical protein ALP20_200126 [Pseudomonas coronafaciens pv. coronafaciens]|nr:hypothetical protein ALP20_200126 [Pseudomonas coronafaciens pv. coronafaciens]
MVVILRKGAYADWLIARPEQSAAFMNQCPASRPATHSLRIVRDSSPILTESTMTLPNHRAISLRPGQFDP